MSSAGLRFGNLCNLTVLALGLWLYYTDWGWVAKLSSTNQASHASYSGMMHGLLGAMMGLLIVTIGVLLLGLINVIGLGGHIKALEGRLGRLDAEVAALRRTESS